MFVVLRGGIDMNLKAIGNRIKEQRMMKKISQEKLAELVDVTPSYISNIESGNRIGSLSTMMEIARVLDSSLDYLLLNDLTNNYNDTNTDKLLVEFKNIFTQLEDKEIIKEYIEYCKSIAKTMIEIKK